VIKAEKKDPAFAPWTIIPLAIQVFSAAKNKKITTTDRQGKVCSFSRMGLSVGAVIIAPSLWIGNIDLSEEAAIAKHCAKFHLGSFLYIHRPVDQVSRRPTLHAAKIQIPKQRRKEAELSL